ncbi:type VI secretion system baseplate subunit TssG [Thalassotalea ganghwensis]
MSIAEQPNWHKLSEKLTTLHQKPWQFSLFRAMHLLEKEWASSNELEQGLSQRVLITPYKELSFPSAEVKACQLTLKHRGKFNLKTTFSGLYGADAAMPHYLLEQAASDDEAGARTRAFLDMFNHHYYCLLYQAWKKSQLTIDGIGSRQYDQVINAILANNNERHVNAGVAGLKTTSASGMASLLNEEFGLAQIVVNDSAAHWQPLEKKSVIGSDEGCILGQSMMLGDQVLVSGGKVVIHFGEMAANDAQQFFPGQSKGNNLYSVVNRQLPSDLPWSCHFVVHYSHKPIQTLGQDNLVLGTASHVGEVSPKASIHIFKDVQYKSRLRLNDCA